MSNEGRLATAEELLAELRRQIIIARTQKAWAQAHGLSEQYLTDVLHGRREIAWGLAHALGYRRVIHFEALPPTSVEEPPDA